MPISVSKAAIYAPASAASNCCIRSRAAPVAPNIPPLDPDLRPETGHFRAQYIEPAKLQSSLTHWTDVYNDYFR